RRLESRTARRVIKALAFAAVAAVALTALGAWLSIAETWQERVLRDGHTAAVRQVVFSPDGRLLVSCSEDGHLIVWDFARRERVATRDIAAQKVAFSPDGRWLAAGGRDGTITILETTRWESIRILRGHKTEIGALTVSPDGTLLASASYEPQPRTIVWETRRWERIGEWPVGGYGTFVFSPDD